MNRGPLITGLSILFWGIAVVFLSLRIYSGYLRKQRALLHDYLNLAGFFFSTALVICIVCDVVYGGLGSDPSVLAETPWKREIFGKLLIAIQMLWVIAVTLMRLSVFSLYTYLFSIARWFHITFHAMQGVVILWAFANIFVIALICRPLTYNWDKTIHDGHCSQKTPFYLYNQSFNLVINMVIALLPVPALWGLQMRTATKVSVGIMFALGVLTCSTSVVRLVFYSLAPIYDHFPDNSKGWMLHVFTVAEPLLTCALASISLIRSLGESPTSALFPTISEEAVWECVDAHQGRSSDSLRQVRRSYIPSWKPPSIEQFIADLEFDQRELGRQDVSHKRKGMPAWVMSEIVERQFDRWAQEIEQIAPKTWDRGMSGGDGFF